MAATAINNKIIHYLHSIEKVKKEMSKIVVGQHDVIKGLLRGVLSNGHVLVEGVPGIAKTLIIRSLANATGCNYSRIQFTVDLLPTDITGIVSYDEKKGFHVIKGPIFSNFIMADEINRAPPKTQSALLESMQEHQCTIGKNTYKLDPPFFVMATQNPIEQAGTYPLPEAQLDRFLFKLHISYPKPEEEQLILNQNMSLKEFSDYNIKPAISRKTLISIQDFVRTVHINKDVEKYIVNIIDSTRNPEKYKVKLGRYIDFGASPRASIGLYIASKAEALMSGKAFVTPNHVKNVAHDVLRHRILINYEGQADNIIPDKIVSEILSRVKVP